MSIVHAVEWLLSWVAAYPIAAYAIIFLLMLLEGEFVILLTSLFTWQGYLDWGPLILVLFAGAYLGNLMWYEIGARIQGTRLGRWWSSKASRAGGWAKEKIVERYATFAVISKFMYGTNHATLVLMGWSKYPFKKFAWITFYANSIWLTIMLSIGYFFGVAVATIGFHKVIRKIEIVLLLMVVGFYFLEYIIRKILLAVTKKPAEGREPLA